MTRAAEPLLLRVLLQNAFGSAFKGVEQLEPESMKASVGTVDMHLNMLRGAIAGFGGSVEVSG